MTLSIPLVVHIGTSGVQRCITAAVRDLTLRKVVPGGFASISLDLDRPVSDFSPEIAAYATVQVTDGRHGGIICEGRLEDPGRSNDSTGGHRRILATGPSAFFDDDSAPQIWIDSAEQNWRKWAGGTGEEVQWEMETESPIDGGPGILQSFNAGTAATPTPPRSKTWGSDYVLLAQTGQTVGTVVLTHREGFTNATAFGSGGYQFKVIEIGGSTLGTHGATSTSDRAFDLTGAGGVSLRAYWEVGSTATIATNEAIDCWFRVAGVVVKPKLKDKTGAVYTSALHSHTLASEIVGDLLGGGRLPLIDGAGASITADVNTIPHFAFPEGVTARQAFEALMVSEPDRYFAAWETNLAGKHRFEWAAWPTTIRYEVSVADGFESPGSTADLYNKVHVLYRDAAGVDAVVTRTRANAVLDAVGVVRSAILNLGSNGANTTASAQVAGDNFLAERAYPVNGGTARISRPIVDRYTGRTVFPYEIMPGSLLAVTDAAPASGAGVTNVTRDGATVFRVVAVDYRASDNTADLSLDVNTRTLDQRVAALSTGGGLAGWRYPMTG